MALGIGREEFSSVSSGYHSFILISVLDTGTNTTVVFLSERQKSGKARTIFCTQALIVITFIDKK